MEDQSQIANRKSQLIAWQGLSLRVPATWNPVKIEGDYDRGSLLLADLSSPRLGVRWRRAGRGEPKAWADRALRDELGAQAAGEAIDFAMAPPDAWNVGRLYVDRDPPGRDVFVAWSTRTGRVIEIVYNAAERDDVLAKTILPTLTDTPADATHHWSIFGLDLQSPAGLALQSFALNAGDLSLTFGKANTRTTVRRIGPASLALSRQPLSKWLTISQKSHKKMYRPPARGEPTTLISDGRQLSGLTTIIHRRRRLFWAWFVPKSITALAIHDAANDRLLIGDSADETLLRELLTALARNLLPLPLRDEAGGGVLRPRVLRRYSPSH